MLKESSSKLCTIVLLCVLEDTLNSWPKAHPHPPPFFSENTLAEGDLIALQLPLGLRSRVIPHPPVQTTADTYRPWARMSGLCGTLILACSGHFGFLNVLKTLCALCFLADLTLQLQYRWRAVLILWMFSMWKGMHYLRWNKGLAKCDVMLVFWFLCSFKYSHAWISGVNGLRSLAPGRWFYCWKQNCNFFKESNHCCTKLCVHVRSCVSLHVLKCCVYIQAVLVLLHLCAWLRPWIHICCLYAVGVIGLCVMKDIFPPKLILSIDLEAWSLLVSKDLIEQSNEAV